VHTRITVTHATGRFVAQEGGRKQSCDAHYRPRTVTDEFRNRTLDLLETVVHIAATTRIGIGKDQLAGFRKTNASNAWKPSLCLTAGATL